MTRDEAIQKAIKLLRLSQSSNPHEAALAAQRAQEILTKFDISQAMLEESKTDGTKMDPEEPIFDMAKKGEFLDSMGNNLVGWKSRLAMEIGKANGCFCYIAMIPQQRKDWGPIQNKKHISLIGRQSDITVVNFLYQHCSREVERITRENGKGKGKNWSTQFRHGMVDTICERVRKAKQETIQEMRQEYQTNPMALMCLNKALVRIEKKNEDVIRFVKEESNMKFKNRKSSHGEYNPDARAQGREAGKQVSLNKTLEGNPNRKMIG
jgi:hypothetical protein